MDIENAGGGGAGSRADSLGAHGDLSTTRQNRARAVASAPRSIGADVIPTQARRQGAGSSTLLPCSLLQSLVRPFPKNERKRRENADKFYRIDVTVSCRFTKGDTQNPQRPQPTNKEKREHGPVRRGPV